MNPQDLADILDGTEPWYKVVARSIGYGLIVVLLMALTFSFLPPSWFGY